MLRQHIVGTATSRLLIVLAALVLVLPSAATGQAAGPSAGEVRAREIAVAKAMSCRDLDAFLPF